ncbi:MAG TPA: hypothetical protein ENI18_11045 [Candidatus Aminicenantes bacterium]|nr:hypothetical protein [Candidatus Aminicenantes bacterium]
MPRKKKTKPELKVVFDTSVLFSKVAYDLVRNEVRQLIESNSKHVDLSTRWYLPRIVVDERRYQMQRKAFELFPSIVKLERLLGHNLNITEKILRDRVDEAINKQLEELAISIFEIDIKDIDWEALIQRASFRLPPFDPGEKEKGFRDSLIAESFLQLVKQSPATSSICRLAMVTSDGLLTEFMNKSTKETRNVRVLSSINELESLINTLVSTVTEEFVAEMIKKASKYFWEKGNDSSLYYKESIRDTIKELYSQELNAPPREGLLRENDTWWITDPTFVKKERQRIFWITQITVDAKLFRYARPEPKVSTPLDFVLGPTGPTAHIGPTDPSVHFGTYDPTGGFKPSINFEQQYRGAGVIGISAPSQNKVEVSSGQSSFEVHWSVNITQKKNFTSPSVVEIKFVSTKWDGE